MLTLAGPLASRSPRCARPVGMAVPPADSVVGSLRLFYPASPPPRALLIGAVVHYSFNPALIVGAQKLSNRSTGASVRVEGMFEVSSVNGRYCFLCFHLDEDLVSTTMSAKPAIDSHYPLPGRIPHERDRVAPLARASGEVERLTQARARMAASTCQSIQCFCGYSWNAHDLRRQPTQITDVSGRFDHQGRQRARKRNRGAMRKCEARKRRAGKDRERRGRARPRGGVGPLGQDGTQGSDVEPCPYVPSALSSNLSLPPPSPRF